MQRINTIIVYSLAQLVLFPLALSQQEDFQTPALRRYKVLIPTQSGISHKRDENISPSKKVYHNTNIVAHHEDALKLIRVKFPPMQGNVLNETVCWTM